MSQNNPATVEQAADDIATTVAKAIVSAQREALREKAIRTGCYLVGAAAVVGAVYLASKYSQGSASDTIAQGGAVAEAAARAIGAIR